MELSFRSVIRSFGISRLFLYLFAAFLIYYIGFTAFYLLYNSGSNSTSGASLQPHLSEAGKQKDDELLRKYDLTKINVDDLTGRVQELLEIRVSVLKELRQLERNRSAVIQLINERNNELEKLKGQISKRGLELERLQLHIKQALFAQKEAKERVDALIEPPLDLLPKHAQIPFNETLERSFQNAPALSNRHCQMFNCFDYSRCSLFSPFYVYIYNFEDTAFRVHARESRFTSTLSQLFKTNVHVTKNSKIACVYMVVIFEQFTYLNDRDKFAKYLHSLPHWGGDGRNNIIVNLAYSHSLSQLKIDPMKAMLVQSSYTFSEYRTKYDLILPSLPFAFNYSTSHNDFAPTLSPARRKYFISYLGFIQSQPKSSSSYNNVIDIRVRVKEALLNVIAKHNSAAHNEFLFDFDCDEKTKRLCENQTIILLDSTFTLILPPKSLRDSSQLFTPNLVIHDEQLNSQIMNSFSTGAIPILIGGDHLSLPFEDVIDWNRAVVRIPLARITELYVVLKTFTDSDIIEMRRFGSFIFRNYFSSLDQVVGSLFAYLRAFRLKIPSRPVPNEYSEFYYNQTKFDQLSSNNQSTIYSFNKVYSDDEENVGPLEPPFSSLVFRRNFTISLTQQYSTWNEPFNSPFHTYPSLVSDPVLPSESKFIGSSYRFRPIGEGTGGSGREFSEAIGGNIIYEQFTIVFLTYERESILLGALQRLKDLPYLNKVIVVWNSPHPPTPGIKWPEIGVDIVVIKSKRNSLNNRFLPFDEIKTDAIFSMDDDASFRHDEIIFAFRVWREARDRIVGFPARFHAWDAGHSAWLYNSNYTCEFSMILTGAAFFHKYYAYLYTYSMPAPIRDKVDEYMNCEDIAMNFLVSHISRKPPIKVTSRWTFRCPECSSSLSEDDLHYQRRHKCLNHFASVYGYMPLLYTQFRADSVLFKTRIPHDKQKCFKYI